MQKTQLGNVKWAIAWLKGKRTPWAIEALADLAEELAAIADGNSGAMPELTTDTASGSGAVTFTPIVVTAAPGNKPADKQPRKPKRAKAKEVWVAKPAAAGPDAPALSDTQMKVLRYLEKHGASTSSKIAQDALKKPAMAGPLGGKILPAIERRGLVTQNDGFWRCTEKGAEVALDA